MGTTRTSYAPELKVKVALEAIISDAVGGKSTKEIAESYQVHPTQVNQWKRKALTGLVQIFSRKQDSEDTNLDVSGLTQKLDKMLSKVVSNDSDDTEDSES